MFDKQFHSDLLLEDLQNLLVEQQSGYSVKGLLHLMVRKWLWFVGSLVTCLALAYLYLLMTPTYYERSASLLFKDEQASSSTASATSQLTQIVTGSPVNINNEVLHFQSPDMMYEAIKRLALDMSYTTKGFLHDQVRYGDDLPLKAVFMDIRPQEEAHLQLLPKDETHVILSDFNKNAMDLGDQPLIVTIGKVTRTPIGRVLIQRNLYRGNTKFTDPMTITHRPFNEVLTDFCSHFKAVLDDQNTTILRLSLRDESMQRAEDVLHALITIYNENWLRDKREEAQATSRFINERINVIQQELGMVDDNISNYKSNNLIPDAGSTVNEDIRQSSESSSQMLTINNQLSIARYLLNFIQKSKNHLLPSNAGVNEQSIESQINSYNQLQLQRNRLAGNSSEENLLVKDIDQQLASLKSSIVSSIHNYIVSLNMQLNSYKTVHSTANSRISNNPRQAGHLLGDVRQQKVKEALYLFLLQKREENELSQAYVAYNNQVISTPERSAQVITSPDTKKTMTLAVLLGLLLPMVVLFIQDISSTATHEQNQ